MDGLKGSSNDVGADVSDSSEIHAFQFGEDDLSLMGDYYALRLINERFARISRGVFLPMLRVQPRIGRGDCGEARHGGALCCRMPDRRL